MKIRTLLNKAVTGTMARASSWHPAITRGKLVAFGVTLIAVGFALGGLEKAPPPALSTGAGSIPLALPGRAELETAPPAEIIETAMLAASSTPSWDSVEVRSGQTLDGIFREQSFSIGQLHEILRLDEDTAKLTRIRPGDVFDFQRHEDGSLAQMRYPIDEENFLIVSNLNDTLLSERLPREIFVERQEAEGQIESSLFLAAKAAGLSDNMTMQLANIFGWDIDFVLDIRSGDQFFVVYEKIYRDGEYLRDGNILGATFINQGERFQAFRFEVDGVGRYFAEDGRPMRKAFLRAPLNFSYISSSFNPKRFHPILRRIKAHNGIDYRAPSGTPVYSAGDGRVIKSAYDKYNGHHVFIQHAGSIVTKYLHFTKRNVKNGDRVKQGQVIGTVGSTGMSQAPHLHYEFLVNGVHRNPRTVPLPKVDPLEGTVLTAFLAQAAPVQAELGRLESASMYASRD